MVKRERLSFFEQSPCQLHEQSFVLSCPVSFTISFVFVLTTFTADLVSLLLVISGHNCHFLHGLNQNYLCPIEERRNKGMKNVSPFVEIFPLNYFFTTWQLSHMKGMQVALEQRLLPYIYLLLKEEGSRPIFYFYIEFCRFLLGRPVGQSKE